MAPPPLLTLFVQHVLDVPLANDVIEKEYILEGIFLFEKLLAHAFTRGHALYVALWHHTFGNYPTQRDFQDFLVLVGCGFPDKPPGLEHAAAMLQSMSHPLMPHLSAPKAFVDECIARFHQPTAVLHLLYEKWAHRFLASNAEPSSPLQYFAALRQSSALPEDAGLGAKCPLTQHVVDIVISPAAAPSERLQYRLTQNRHFMGKWATSPVITIADSVHVEDPALCAAITHIQKATGKRALVFTNTPLSIPGALEYPYHEALWPLFPRTALWHLHIANEDVPNIAGAAKDPRNNVFWTRMDKLPAMPPASFLNYDRVLTDDQTKFTTIISYFHAFPLQPHFWKLHTTASCPIRTSHPNHNALVFYDFLFKYAAAMEPQIQELWTRPCPGPQCPNALVLLDNRPNEQSVLAMLIALVNVPAPTWGARLYTSRAALSFYQERLPPCVQVLVHPTLDTPVFDIDIYNDAMQDMAFWKELEAADITHVLILQDDGLLLKPGIEQRFMIDPPAYIGAPWRPGPENAFIQQHINPDLVGNGGFSLRSVAATLQVLGDPEAQADRTALFYHNINRIPEDVFFVKHMRRLGHRLPTAAHAAKFASEQILNPLCLGVHKVWVYHPLPALMEFLSQLLNA